jgi:hypothetical protein
MRQLAPIAIFLYNRPDHAQRTLDSLSKNVLADNSELFIFSDAAKDESAQKQVEQVREFAKTVTGFKRIEIIERTTNVGLANSIINGVTQLVNQYGKVIVFEDDLVSSLYTLQYFNDALDRYANQPKVMHVGAYMYNLKTPNLPETFFYRAATSWGWATWARAWKNFEPNVDMLMAQFDDAKVHQFSIEGTMNFWKQMQEFKTGKNNSWAIRWYASVFLQHGLTLNPSQSLIHNIGHDGSGTHSNNEDMYQVQVAQKPVTQFPATLQENPQAYQAIKQFLKNRKGSLWQRGVRFLKQTLEKNKR